MPAICITTVVARTVKIADRPAETDSANQSVLLP